MGLLQIEEPSEIKNEEKEEFPIIGIDLGTTNSLVGVVVNGETRFFKDEAGREIHKSVVAFDENGEFVAAGNEADLGEFAFKIYSVKRLMGKGFDDVDQSEIDFEVERDEDGSQNFKILVGKKKYSPEEISGFILSYLKGLAIEGLGIELDVENLGQTGGSATTDLGGEGKSFGQGDPAPTQGLGGGHEKIQAVITVPAYFDEGAKNSTKFAADLAGIEVLRLVNEPTAAALAYGLDSSKQGIYGVFDLGGGTFDVSVLKMRKGVFQVLGVSGNNHLGGDDFDFLVERILREKLGGVVGGQEREDGNAKIDFGFSQAQESDSRQEEGREQKHGQRHSSDPTRGVENEEEEDGSENAKDYGFGQGNPAPTIRKIAKKIKEELSEKDEILVGEILSEVLKNEENFQGENSNISIEKSDENEKNFDGENKGNLDKNQDFSENLENEALKIKDFLKTATRSNWKIGKNLDEKFLENLAKIKIRRTEFEEKITPKINETIELTKNLLKDLEVEIGDEKKNVQGLILVGGSSRIPLIQEKLKEIFGSDVKIFTDLNPDMVVGQGAVLQAFNLGGGGDSLLLDVLPLSLGVEMMGGIVDKVIQRNTTIPTSYAKEFTTYADNQTGMKFKVVQGEREFAKDCRELAEFEVKGIPPLRAGLARVLVTFKVDADGLLTIVSEEKMTAEKQEIVVKPSFGLDENQVKKMLVDSLQNSKTDISQRLLVEAKREAKQNIDFVRRDLREYSKMVSAEEKQLIEEKANKLEEILADEKSSKDEVVGAQKELEKASAGFVLKKMDASLGEYVGKGVDEV